ncbi:MAG: hypothetical protein M3020_09380 [Myxococcota bacterium]|nr:hypothetical protein [Myxococcota bacterium]
MFHSTTTRTVTAALIALGFFACNREGDKGEGTGRGPGDEAAHSRATDVSVNDGSRPVDDSAGRSRDADQVPGQSEVVTNPGNGSGGVGSGAAGSAAGGRTQNGSGGTSARP